MNTKEDLPGLATVSWLKIVELLILATPLGRFYYAFPHHIITGNALAKLKSLEPESRFSPRKIYQSVSDSMNDSLIKASLKTIDRINKK
jgi:hypothetical protein